VLTGPNLPHNWVSNLGQDQHLAGRDLVLQFSRPFVERMVGAIPELAPLQELLDGAARGLQFPDALGTSIIPLMQELAQASGARRVVLMMSVLEQLASCPNADHWRDRATTSMPSATCRPPSTRCCPISARTWAATCARPTWPNWLR
jgi:hypothetical protein